MTARKPSSLGLGGSAAPILKEAFLSVCNQIVPFAMDNRFWNRVAWTKVKIYS